MSIPSYHKDLIYYPSQVSGVWWQSSFYTVTPAVLYEVYDVICYLTGWEHLSDHTLLSCFVVFSGEEDCVCMAASSLVRLEEITRWGQLDILTGWACAWGPLLCWVRLCYSAADPTMCSFLLFHLPFVQPFISSYLGNKCCTPAGKCSVHYSQWALLACYCTPKYPCAVLVHVLYPRCLLRCCWVDSSACLCILLAPDLHNPLSFEIAAFCGSLAVWRPFIMPL